MSNETRTGNPLYNWYRKRVRPFLQEEEPDRITELDREVNKLEEREKTLFEPMSACFVGGAGIGKSTLINAMVAGDKIVVPSGGVGPLTAQALQIAYGATPAFTAIYHPPAKVWKLGFALESINRRQSLQSQSVRDSELAKELDEDDIAEVESQDLDAGSKVEYLRKQAQLMITGKQDSDCELPYLVDSIREAIGQKRVWGTVAKSEDIARLKQLVSILVTDHRKSPAIHEAVVSSPGFSKDLHDHSAGFLAPTIEQLEVWWNSPLLEKGLRLIDLPGLGVAGDVYRKVTEQWVRMDAHVVVLVVTHRGVMEADANLLRTSGFLTRLLHSIDDPAMKSFDGY